MNVGTLHAPRLLPLGKGRAWGGSKLSESEEFVALQPSIGSSWNLRLQRGTTICCCNLRSAC